METLQIEHLTFAYPMAGENALTDVSLTLAPGSFTLLCGPSGSGKTTLLRHLRTALTPHGARGGKILLSGVPLDDVPEREQTEKLGFVLQQPADQIVTDKVWHELAFGLENLGVEPETMRLRVGEMASYFGIQDWFDRPTDTLSGGQMQLLNLAAVMAMQPEILILDEPTAQLDPIAAGEFLRAVERLNRELGVTILLSEHRLDAVLPMADQIAVLRDGRLAALGAPETVARALAEKNDPFFTAFPLPARLWAALGFPGACPPDVRAGRALLRKDPPRRAVSVPEAAKGDGEPALSMKELWFRYERDGKDVLRGASFTVGRGEIFAVVGGNASGKSTLLGLIAGTLRPYHGKVGLRGRAALLPQDPRVLFRYDAVAAELDASGGAAEDRAALAEALGLSALSDRNPGDLSGGEQQRLAIAMLLLRSPDVLLLDEPTKGMDAQARLELGALLQTLCARGLTIVLVSHDLAFCARFADRAALLFDGQILSSAPARAFFTGNHFYTTEANRLARPWLPDALLPEEVIAACKAENR